MLAAAAQAQSSDGSIFGRAPAGATVAVTGVDTGLSRQVVVGSDGTFQLSKLPPGRYTVTANGVKRDVNVVIGSGIEVSFDSTQRVEITGSRINTMIDTSSVESSTVFTAAQIQALPVERSVNAVAMLAPGTVRGDSFGAGLSLPSFSGASIAENGYFINGLDVTNIRNFLSYADLPFDAIEQQQIKSGGYGAEYGRSLGGVINLVTKRGTNNWDGGVSLYWEPAALRSQSPNVATRDPDPEQPSLYRFNSANRYNALSLTGYVGGPIIEDKLFFFGAIDMPYNTTDSYSRLASRTVTNRTPMTMVKVDFTPTDQHLFEFTGIYNPSKRHWEHYDSNTEYASTHDTPVGSSDQSGGGHVLIGKYTGYLTENLTASALLGYIVDNRTVDTGVLSNGSDCPTVYDTALNPLGCWNGIFPGAAQRDPTAPADRDVKRSWRLDLEYVMGSHTIRAGYDAQHFQSWEAGGSIYSGGHYYRYYTSASGTVNGVPNAVEPGGTYVRDRIYRSTSGSYVVVNNALYVEDSWRVTKDVLLYGGLRWESFDNKNSDGVSFVNKKNLLAPRLGAAWDVDGDGSFKIYGNLGRYYIPVASNSNIRMTRGEIASTSYYTYSGMDPVTAAPLGLSGPIGTSAISGDGTLPDPGTVAATNLQPMSQDELILGIQKAVSKDLVLGARGVYRRVNNGMDDYCDDAAIVGWAQANGHPNASWAGCILMNPGSDLKMRMDLNGDGILGDITIPASTLGLAPYKRTYQALELTAERPFDGTWSLKGSYTLSRSRGTAEGYVQSTLQQEDAGVSQDFDFGTFTDGANGYLPNDRRHAFKVYGNYQVTPEWRVGANVTLASGRPLSCIGFVPEAVAGDSGVLNYTSPSSYYCLNGPGTVTSVDANGDPVTPQLETTTPASLVPRGSVGRTPWTSSVDVQLSYVPQWADNKLTLQLDVFNLFNSAKAVRLTETRDLSRGDSNGSGPWLQNPNYLNVDEFQEPRYVRLTARYKF